MRSLAFLTPSAVAEEDVRGKTAIIVDVFRATTTILTALERGARMVIPVADMNEAGQLASNLDPSAFLLAGERLGKKIEGYHLGNSPSEMLPEVIAGKTIILTTTNGTRAVAAARGADHIVSATFRNLNASVEYVKALGKDVVVVASGWRGRLSLEDTLCAGYLLSELHGTDFQADEADDAFIAHSLYQRYKAQLTETLRAGSHAHRLHLMQADADVDYALHMNVSDGVPRLKDGAFVLK